MTDTSKATIERIGEALEAMADTLPDSEREAIAEAFAVIEALAAKFTAATERADKAEAENNELVDENATLEIRAHAAESRVAALEGAAQSLLDRIDKLDWSLGADAISWDFYGHVEPSAARLRALLAAHSAPAPQVSQAAADVLAERRRQIEVEGWTPEHDDEHADGELALAADCYEASGDGRADRSAPACWPWANEWWKPTSCRRDYVKAHALRQAEIDRLTRQNKRLLDKIEIIDVAAAREG